MTELQRDGTADTMRYHAGQFRAARVALLLKTKTIAAGARMSARTLNEIEQSDRGTAMPSEDAVQRLVEFYEGEGVTFLSNAAHGPGIRFKLKRASP